MPSTSSAPPSPANSANQPGVRVVVLGAGFAGLTFCKRFRHPSARITLVDRTNHHLFQPLLYQVATAGLSAPDVAQPIRSILSRHPRLQVLMDDVRAIDLVGRRVICERSSLEYDYLVLALGGVTSYFNHPEWEAHAPGLKTLEDAMKIRNRVLLAFERAENEPDRALHDALMTILVVGGGPTGVEVAGACAELAHHVLRRDFDHIDPAQAKIVLIEGGDRILSHLPSDLSEKARRQLEKKGVRVRTGCKVRAIEPGAITLETGERLPAETIIWAAGVMAHPLTRTLAVPLDRAGRIRVEPDLSLPGHPEVFAVGDIAAVESAGKPVPGVAPAAIQMAQHIADLLRREMNGGRTSAPRKPFKYWDKGTLATIGRNAGVAWLGPVRLSGWLAWISWLLVHLIFLIGFRNKISVLFSWTYSYFTYKVGARIIFPGAGRR